MGFLSGPGGMRQGPTGGLERVGKLVSQDEQKERCIPGPGFQELSLFS